MAVHRSFRLIGLNTYIGSLGPPKTYSMHTPDMPTKRFFLENNSKIIQGYFNFCSYLYS